MKKTLLLLSLCLPVSAAFAQKKVGIGTNNPQQRLSIDSTLVIDQGNFNNGSSLTLRLGSFSGEGIGSNRNFGSNVSGLDLWTGNQKRIQIFNNGNVRIGTSADSTAKLAVDGEIKAAMIQGTDIVVDRTGTNTGLWNSGNPSLLFGSDASGELISSSRSGSLNFLGLDFWTGGTAKMSLTGSGNLGIGVRNPTHKLQVDGNIVANMVQGTDLVVDRNAANIGEWNSGNPALLFGGDASGELISSSRSGTLNYLGLDFWAGGQPRMSLLNGGNLGIGVRNPTNKLQVAGTILTTGNLVVQTNKGIIRNSGSTQLKQVVTSVVVNYSAVNIPALGTVVIPVSWAENFSGTPVAAYVGNSTSGAGGWAEVVMSISGASTTGCSLYIFNPRNAPTGPNFTINIVAIGPQ